MTKPVILTGLRANNDLHIGNYFGALLPLVDMAKSHAGEYEINLFVPDLHSFTTPIDHSQLQAQIQHNLKLFVAAGLPLDDPAIHIYRQSYISAHSELTWVLDCFTGFGQMRRMTQFKDKTGSARILDEMQSQIQDVHNQINLMEKSQNSTEHLNLTAEYIEKINNVINDYAMLNELEGSASVGLFNYPVLMAADILLYHASYVPVGEDQTQHLEYTRDIAERMNNQFGELFVVPKPVKEQHEFFGKEQGLRIKDLADPTKKMSKSDELGKGVIFLGDDPEAAAKKIMSATTDSVGAINYDMENQPGISNLLQILALLTGKPVQDVASEWKGKTSYGELKSTVAEAVRTYLTRFQSALSKVDDVKLQAKLEADEKQMNEIANATLLRVQKAVGLRPS